MSEPVSYSEEECFNVDWKIKNFSYCCERIQSPEFSFCGNFYCIRLNLLSLDIQCGLNMPVYYRSIPLKIQISFLTCDGSPEESISGDNVNLKVPKNVIFGKMRDSFLPEDTLTVRFRHSTESERGKIFVYSLIGVKRKFFLWSFKNFSKLQSYSNKSLEKSESYGDMEFCIQSMGGNNPTEQFNIEISRTDGERIYSVLKISMVQVDGKAVNEVMDEFVFEKENRRQTRSFPLIIKKSKLLAYDYLLLPNDTLSLKCEFAVSLGKVTDQTVITSYCEDVIPLLKESGDLSMIFKPKNHSGSVTELQTDLKNLLENGTLSDVNLEIGSEVIPAHKSILSARSPVFRAMLANDMAEANSSTVVIEDLDMETVRVLLLYMYTDTLHNEDWDNVKKLYVASDKYEVLSLKGKCVSFLKTNFSVPNVCEALLLADLYQDADLKIAATDFISECDSEVFVSEEWEELEKNNPHLALKVLREINRNIRMKMN